jgi:hypothetical protein
VDRKKETDATLKEKEELDERIDTAEKISETAEELLEEANAEVSMQELTTLDFTDHKAILDWIYNYALNQRSKYKETIIKAFIDH